MPRFVRCVIDGVSARRHPLYPTWAGMLARCSNPKHTVFRYYGARGITVCERWRASFAAFVEDMGPKPTPKHQIDRVDNDRGYVPGNCRWTTSAVNNANRRRPDRPAAFARIESRSDARIRRQLWRDLDGPNDVFTLASYDALEDLVAAFGRVDDDFDETVLAFGWGLEG